MKAARQGVKSMRLLVVEEGDKRRRNGDNDTGWNTCLFAAIVGRSGQRDLIPAIHL
jgi:hypothetical protein